jgi:hypothetical protein
MLTDASISPNGLRAIRTVFHDLLHSEGLLERYESNIEISCKFIGSICLPHKSSVGFHRFVPERSAFSRAGSRS